jgi:hypothetical protein
VELDALPLLALAGEVATTAIAIGATVDTFDAATVAFLD